MMFTESEGIKCKLRTVPSSALSIYANPLPFKRTD